MSERTGHGRNGGASAEPSQVAHATEEALWRKSLTEAAHRWNLVGRDTGVLCHGSLLVHAMDYEDLDDLEAEFVRASVAECLRTGKRIDAELAVPQLVRILIELLSDQDYEICSKAGYALERMVSLKCDLAPPSIDGLIERLAGPAGPVRAQAAKVLEKVARLCPEQVMPQTVDILVELLSDPDPDVSSRAMYTLKRVAEDRSDLVGQVAVGAEHLLDDPHDAVRARAMTVLEAAVKASPDVITPQMVETVAGLFRDSSSDVCSRAQYILARVIASRPDLVLQIAALLDGLMDDVEVSVRARATRVLEKVVQADSRAATEKRVRTLARLSQGRNDEVSLPARYVLKRIVEISPDLVQGAGTQGAGPLALVVP